MDLIKLINKYKDEISNDSILIEYNLFFSEDVKKYCKFVIDEYEELEKLNNVLLKLKELDKDIEIYVCTYGVDFIESEIHIYGDTLWINTKTELEKIYECFRNCRIVEPSDIVMLCENEGIDGTVALAFSMEGKVENYTSFIEKRQINKIKSLYWD